MFLSATVAAQLGFIAVQAFNPAAFERACKDASSCGGSSRSTAQQLFEGWLYSADAERAQGEARQLWLAP